MTSYVRHSAGSIRMRNPDGTGCSWEGVTFAPDEHGVVEIPVEAVAHVQPHGYESVPDDELRETAHDVKGHVQALFGGHALKDAEKTIAELRTQLKDRDDRIGTLETELAAAKATVAKQHGRIEALDAEVEAAERRITKLLNEAQLPKGEDKKKG
jgi:septal ring factor EnvC (AmiA/AmiB activator)